MSILLALLYPIAIQIERCGLWRVLLPVTVVALVIDVIANYTELALLTWDWPRSGEYTYSQRLKRLKYSTGVRGAFARWCVSYCNYFDPQRDHV